jgi:hypothetical protein
MYGVAVLRALLIADEAMTSAVPAERIIGGTLPVGTALDAISITRISVVDRNVPSPGAQRHVTERVQISALAATYPRCKAVLRAAKKACADYIGDVADVTEVTVHTAGAGPDFMDEQASIHMGSQDFIVGYNEAR